MGKYAKGLQLVLKTLTKDAGSLGGSHVFVTEKFSISFSKQRQTKSLSIIQ